MELGVACTIFAFLLFLCFLLWISRKAHTNTNKLPPEATGAWPFIGHLPLLRGPQPAYITLGNIADKDGPLFTIKLGAHRALVVSSLEMAKECLTTNDKVFANRPKSLAAELMGYNFAMFGFSPYGPYWRQIRKTATVELLSNHRLEMLKNVRESEVKASIKEVYDLWKNNKGKSKTVEMRRWFGDVNLNIIFRMVVGKRYVGATTPSEMEESERCRKALRDFFKLGGGFVISDALPFLRWLDLGGHGKAMKQTAKELDDVLERWLKQHKQKRVSRSGEIHDFMDLMLSVLDEAEDHQSPSTYDSDTINKATCLVLILGGTDTTTVSLTWALSMLLNNREILKKAQDELDQQVGRERHVEESDMNNLIYLQAIIKETLRLYPSAPLSVPHESIEDCTVGGYHVPAGTRLIINIGKIQRDPRVWSDPYQFQPERFLTTCKDFDVRGQNFELIPFGSGRRVCPGISLALQVMQLILANLLHAFEITTPLDEPVDLGETSGLTNMKATPLEVILTPRLSVDY
ncbi:cytochrome P450 CYP82D47 [Ziziphus jujuba]|uniref:Cytochrome P450 CYP82D47 n=1 Tax=Ziziphus jujuba TaxID=326968 RepID=A0A6P4AG35_ZIZJJ|nr:cytochrome P450 CYP82D47 [Ziziphus jujuba]